MSNYNNYNKSGGGLNLIETDFNVNPIRTLITIIAYLCLFVGLTWVIISWSMYGWDHVNGSAAMGVLCAGVTACIIMSGINGIIGSSNGVVIDTD